MQGCVTHLGVCTVASHEADEKPTRLWDENSDVHSKIEAAHDFLVSLGAKKDEPSDDNEDGES